MPLISLFFLFCLSQTLCAQEKNHAGIFPNENAVVTQNKSDKPSPRQPNNSANTANYIEGILSEASRSSLFSPPPCEAEIKDTAGNRLAYVNTENLLLKDPIWSLYGKKVVLYGTFENAGKPDKLVFHANMILY